MPTIHTSSGCFNARTALGRQVQLSDAASAPIANVIAASWNAGMRPDATVSTASSDHIRIAVRPISVAVRGGMEAVIASEVGRVGKANGSGECAPHGVPTTTY